MKPFISLLTLLLTTALLPAQSPFEIKKEKGKVVASFSGSAAEVVPNAPTDADVAALAEHPEIEEISMKGCTNLTGTGFAALKTLPNLRVIRFNGIGPERFSTLFDGNLAGYQALAELDQVEALYFGHVMVPVEGAVVVLEGMDSLQTFGVGTFADDKIIAAAVGAPNLKSLGFGHWAVLPEPNVTMAGFSKYAEMKQLQSLGTGTVPPSDGTARGMLEVLGQMSQLKRLKLAFGGKSVRAKVERPTFEPLTADDLGLLANLTQLELLGLSAITIAEGALPKLAELPNLKRVELKGTEYSKADIEALKAAKPDLTIAE